MTSLGAGTSLGEYVLSQALAEGRCGAVFAAVHQPTGRPAAVRVLPAALSRDAQFVARFPYEARAVGMVRAPGLCEVVEFGMTPDGSAFIVMELIAGEDLGARLRRAGRLGVPEAALLGRHVARALAVAHAGQVSHGLLRPERVVFAGSAGAERTRVLGLGLLRLLLCGGGRSESGAPPVRFRLPRASQDLLYMAPEQIGQAEAGDRADVYSLGAVLYEAMTGAPPAVQGSPAPLAAMEKGLLPPPLCEQAPMVPQELSLLIGQMMARTPAERPPMAEVAGRLEAMSGAGGVLSTMARGKPTLLGGLLSRGQPGRGTLAWAAMVVKQRQEARARQKGGPAGPGLFWGRLVLGAGALALVLAVGGGAMYLLRGTRTAPAPAPAPPPAPTPPPAPAPAPQVPPDRGVSPEEKQEPVEPVGKKGKKGKRGKKAGKGSKKDRPARTRDKKRRHQADG